GAAGLTVQLWQILPPGAPGPGQVRVGGRVMSAHEARRKLDSKDRGMVSEVLGLLKAQTAFVRMKAVGALSAMNLPKTEEAFIPLLEDVDKGVKMAVIKAFEGTRSKKVLPALERVAQNDPDASTQSAAARILSAAGIDKYRAIVLYDKLKDGDDAVVMDAVDKLSKTGKPEVALALIGVLSHRNSQIRDMGMKAVVSLKSDPALRKIVENDKLDMKFRNQSAGLLSAQAGENAELGLRHLLINGTVSEQKKGIGEVAKRRLYKLVADVINLLGSSDSSVRLTAADSLGKIKDSKALAPLADALRKHADEKSKYEAAIISIFGGLSMDEVIRTADSPDKVLKGLSIKSLAKFAEGGNPQPRVVEVLKKKLGDSDLDIRRSAAFALARIKDEGVVNSLVSLKDDPDATIREQVAVALTTSKHAQADAILMTYIEDSKPPVRRAAVDGLRVRGVKAALDKLKFHVKHRDVQVRRAVVHATVSLAGADGWQTWFSVWSQALYDMDPNVKMHALTGIGYRPSDARVPSLVGGLATDPSEDVQLTALGVLGRTGAKDAIEYVARALFEGSPKVKGAALDALKAINLEECGKPIMDFVKVEDDGPLKVKANEVYDSLP
ncbi:MAG: HEAT repeat protein, partial [Myxococcota bacterium]